MCSLNHKMATSTASFQGYRCEFLETVPDDFVCKNCSLVARGLTLVSCCGESFCKSCIIDTQEQGLPCPLCSEVSFNTFEQVKNQRRINSLQVYCSMKERGCVWSGTLDQLDAHLDPHLDNCQFVDTECPLNCLQTVPKNEVDQHVAQECTKRPHVCQHCGFNASYEEIINVHYSECDCIALQCPNMCGVSGERELMEDHMKICRLEEVECEFSSVGCDGRFIREDQDEHARENSQKHLSLIASLAIEGKQQLQLNILAQDKKHKEEEDKLKRKIDHQDKKLLAQEKQLEEQEKKLQEQDKKLGEQDKILKNQEKQLGDQRNKLGEQGKRIGEQKKKLVEQEKQLGEQKIRLGNQEKRLGEQAIKLKEQEKKIGDQQMKLNEQNEILGEIQSKLDDKHDSKWKMMEQALQKVADLSAQKISDLTMTLNLNRNFVMENFSKEKEKDKVGEWKSPPMYAHVNGYKFCIGVDANGWGGGRGKSIFVNIWSMPGEFDRQLTWPAEARFTIELLNQEEGGNAKCTSEKIKWDKPTASRSFNHSIGAFHRVRLDTIYTAFIKHSDLPQFLKNDALHFYVSKISLF